MPFGVINEFTFSEISCVLTLSVLMLRNSWLSIRTHGIWYVAKQIDLEVTWLAILQNGLV